MHKLSPRAYLFIYAVILAGSAALAFAVINANTVNLGDLAILMVLACGAAVLKFRLPGMEGTFSLLFAFVLVAVSRMGMLEAVLVGTLPVLFACLLRTAKRPTADQVLFNLGGHALSAFAAYEVQQRAMHSVAAGNGLLSMTLSGSVFFLMNTGLVSVAIAARSGVPVLQVWRRWNLQCLPYYAAGSALVGIACGSASNLQLKMLAMILPALALLYWYRKSRAEQAAVSSV